MEYSDKGIYVTGKEVTFEHEAGNLPSLWWIKKHLGGLIQLRTKLKLPVSLSQWKKEQDILPTKILDALHQIARLSSERHVSRRYWNAHHGDYASPSCLEYHLGTWNDIVERAGLIALEPWNPGWSLESGLQLLLELGNELRRPPTGADVKKKLAEQPGSMPSKNWYYAHFRGTYPAWLHAMNRDGT